MDLAKVKQHLSKGNGSVVGYLKKVVKQIDAYRQGQQTTTGAAGGLGNVDSDKEDDEEEEEGEGDLDGDNKGRGNGKGNGNNGIGFSNGSKGGSVVGSVAGSVSKGSNHRFRGPAKHSHNGVMTCCDFRKDGLKRSGCMAQMELFARR